PTISPLSRRPPCWIACSSLLVLEYWGRPLGPPLGVHRSATSTESSTEIGGASDMTGRSPASAAGVHGHVGPQAAGRAGGQRRRPAGRREPRNALTLLAQRA